MRKEWAIIVTYFQILLHHLNSEVHLSFERVINYVGRSISGVVVTLHQNLLQCILQTANTATKNSDWLEMSIPLGLSK